MKQPALGMKNVLKQKYNDSPASPAKKPRHMFFCLNKQRLKELKDEYADFVSNYREMLGGFYNAIKNKTKIKMEWPPGSYIPSKWVPVYD